MKLITLGFLLFMLILTLNVEAEEAEENLKLYKNFYYGEAAEEVYKDIMKDTEMRPVNLTESYDEWLETEKYSFTGMLTLDDYYFMKATTKLLEKIFHCIFRIAKEEGILLEVTLYGPEYDFENATEKEMASLIDMIKIKYKEPTWKNINEKDFETISFTIYNYTWRNIWEIKGEEGLKEIKIGLMERTAGVKGQGKYASVMTIKYTPRKVEEKMDVNLEDDAADF